MKVSKKATAFLLAAVLLVSSLFTAAPMYKLFAAEGETHGNFVIYGGTYGVDYEYVTGTSPIQIQGYGTNEGVNSTASTPKSGGVVNVAMFYFILVLFCFVVFVLFCFVCLFCIGTAYSKQ